jgi:threonine synthase
VAVTRKLIEQGRIPRTESIVICITGNGYKTLEAVVNNVDQPRLINARLQEFDELYRLFSSPLSSRETQDHLH